MKIGIFTRQLLVIVPFILSASITLAQGNNVTQVNVNDWGSGFIATYQYDITVADVELDNVRDWRIELNYTGAASLNNVWMEGYSGDIQFGNLAPSGGYAITNEGVGYRPELGAGDTLRFNIQGQGAGFNASEFTPQFINLTELPTNTFSSSLVSVNDWYNPSWGGGFNATFQCDVQGPDTPGGPVTDLLIEFNYSGTGSPSNAWTQSHNGPIEYGYIAPDGGYAISNLGGFQPELMAGDSITFAIQVQGSGFSLDDFDITCSSGSGEGVTPNTPPTSLSLDIDVLENATVAFELQGSDVDGDSLTYQLGFEPLHGEYTLVQNIFTYTPTPGYSGLDSFTYLVNDGSDSSAEAVVSITVISGNQAPYAASQAVSVDEDVAVEIILTGTDEDGDVLVYNILDAPVNGQLSGTAPNLIYTPESNFFGSDSFAFLVNDGELDSASASVSISVVSVNDKPVGIEASYQAQIETPLEIVLVAEDADGDALSFEVVSAPTKGSYQLIGNTVSYSAGINASGQDTFSFIANDGAVSSDPVLITIDIEAVNQAPDITSFPGSSVTEGSLYTYPITAIDPDGDSLNYDLISGSSAGSVDASSGVFSALYLSPTIGSVEQQNLVCRGPLPDKGNFEPVEKWAWNGGHVLSQPMVAPLTDTNGDSAITTADDSVVLAVTWTNDQGSGRLVAVNGLTGDTLWITDLVFGSGSSVAVGDLESDGVPEIVGVTNNGKTIVLDNLGNVKWTSEYPDSSTSGYTNGAPTIADLDGDGQAEILMRGSVLNSDGTLRFKHPEAQWHAVVDVAADLDGDGFQEVLMGDRAFDRFGTELWRLPDVMYPRSFAVFDVDGDSIPEIAMATLNDFRLVRNDGTLIWKVDEPSYNPPLLSVGDINGNGRLEIVGFINGHIAAYDAATGDGLWSEPAYDPSHLTGIALFDFDGDGLQEVVHGGSNLLRAFNGLDGSLLFQIANTSVTASEAPTVVDIDKDGHAELIVTTSSNAGIRVFEDRHDTWVGTRSLWNQYAYYVDNINDDLSVPSGIGIGVSSQNSYLTNYYPDRDPLGLPDLAVFNLALDPEDERTLSFDIKNRGLASSLQLALVEVFNGDPASGGELIASTTVSVLSSGEAQTIEITDDAILALGNTVYVRLNDDSEVVECDVTNNLSYAHVFRVRVADSLGLGDEQRFSVTTTEINEAPLITTQTLPDPDLGVDFRVAIDAVDPDSGDGIAYSLNGAPIGMTIDPAHGGIVWPAVYFVDSDVSFDVTATDLGGLSVSRSYTISTIGLPVIVSDPITSATVGIVYEYRAVTTDPTPQDTKVFNLRSGPATATIDAASGLLRWTPSEVGDVQFQIEVVDSAGNIGTQTFTVSVAARPITASRTVSTNEDIPLEINLDEGNDAASHLSITTQPAFGTLSNTNPVVVYSPNPDFNGTDIFEYVGSAGGIVFEVGQIEINVLPINDAPVIVSTPPIYGKEFTDYSYSVAATDPDNDSLDFSLLTSPAGMSIDASGVINWSPGASAEESVTIAVSDGIEQVTQSWTIDVRPASEVLAASVEVQPDPVVAGEAVVVTVTPSGSVGDIDITATLEGQSLLTDGNSQLSFIAPEFPGDYALDIIVSDALESVEIPVIIVVPDSTGGNDTVFPVVNIDSPDEGTEIIVDAVTVTGSVQDENLASWELALSRRANSSTIMGSGTTPVVGDVLAVIDPTLLMNGIHELTLTATDTAGNSSVAYSSVVIDGDAKIGNFSISFEDLSIPMVGIPIQVTRTYDTRQRGEDLDFGYGWSIDYQNVTVQESRVLGEGWELNEYPTGPLGLLTAYCVEPIGTPKVTVTLPDGQVETFSVGANPRCNTATPILDVVMEFTPESGTTSTIETDSNGLQRLDQPSGILGDIATNEPYDPNRYVLTTKAGYIYTLNQSFGIEQVEDPNGHILTYSDTGITHSAGKSIDFVRDADGRITEISDPAGNLITYNYDANGDLESVTDRAFATTEHTYNANHGLLDIVDPLGRRVVRNIYDDDGRLIAQEDNEGNRTEFNHNLSGRESIVTDRLGRTTVLYYDERGNVTSKIDALGQTYTYTFDEFDNQLNETNALGETTTASFDDRYNQLSQTDALGNTVNYTYNNRGQELTIVDARGNTFEQVYDGAGNLLSVTDPLGHAAGQTINNEGLVASRRDAEGNATTFVYDSEGNITEEMDADGSRMTYTHDDNNNRLSESRERTVDGVTLTETTSYVYNARDQLVSTTDALGHVTQTEYDLAGREIAEVDAKGRRMEMSYDAYGRMIQTLYPDGTSMSSTYDVEGNKLTDTDRLGRVTGYRYDALNRMVETTFADSTSIQTSYDAAGRVSTETDERGNITTHTYDAAGRRVATTNALGDTMSLGYDADGNLVTQTDYRGNTTTHIYNGLDQRIETVYADNTSTSRSYDKRGLEVTQTDQNGRVTSYGYDELGRLTSVTDALGQITAYGYDESGNKLTQTDALGRVTAWAYDALGRPVSRILPLGQIETYGYDEIGKRLTHTDFNGETHTYTYESNNDWLSEERYADGQIISYGYNAIGQRTSATDQHGSYSYVYDNRDRLTRETKPNGWALAYDYDAAGNRTSLSTEVESTTSTVTYSFDALNRMASVTDAENRATAYTYDENGNQTRIDQANGTTSTTTFDALNRITDILHTGTANETLLGLTYTLDATGRRMRIEETSGRASVYTYDELYRLTGDTITDPINGDYLASYTYDAVGNRLTETIDGISQSYVLDNNDRLLSKGSTSYTYDDNGNTLTESDGVTITTSTYDSRNRLVGSDAGGKEISMGYDPEGLRIEKAVDGEVTEYLVDTNRAYGQVLYERAGVSELGYTFGTDLVGLDTQADSYVYHTDALGSTRILTSESGQVSDDIKYDSWGKTLSGGTMAENTYSYTGEQFDDDLNQINLRARYYSPSIARFSQMDEFSGHLTSPITQNKYLYGNDEPTNVVDPSGNVGVFSVGARFTMSTVSTATQLGSALLSQTAGVAIQLSRGIGGKTVLKNVKQCLKKKDKCRIRLNLLIVGADVPTMVDHIRSAQLRRPLTFRLTWDFNNRGKRHKRWYYKKGKYLGGCGSEQKPYTDANCDEYPMQKTTQGGLYYPQRTSLRWVDGDENQRVGQSFGGMTQGMKRTKNYNFYVIPTNSIQTTIGLAFGKKR